jgi:uncharacterized membrane protein YdjX (TVP38/TMEM64 family)
MICLGLLLRLLIQHIPADTTNQYLSADSFKFVTLLRLSPLLPLSASNYLYGLTSVKLGPYIAGSFLGMLPGTWAYVGTGHVGKAVLLEGGGSLNVELWQVRPAMPCILLASKWAR